MMLLDPRSDWSMEAPITRFGGCPLRPGAESLRLLDRRRAGQCVGRFDRGTASLHSRLDAAG
jgi:hypothetical protein